jgi:uncharacterized protein YjaZ
MSNTEGIFLINGEFNGRKDIFIKRLASRVQHIGGIGFAGYDKKKDLEKNLKWQVFDEENFEENFSFHEEKIRKLVEETLVKCLNEVDKKPHIFVFPSYNSFTNKKMGGVGGNYSKYLVMLIFVNTSVKNWEKSLKETICHEFTHAVSSYYNLWENTIGEGIVLDGIAENFQEHILNGKSMFSNILSEEECKEIFKKIDSKLNLNDEKEYNELFYGGGKYKQWTGYALGYWLVKNYLKNLKKIDWEKIINTNPSKILLEIRKAL